MIARARAALAAALAGVAMVAAAQNAALQALGEVESERAFAPVATIYTARRILTLDRSQPVATAVAVGGDRILAVGDLASVSKTLSGRPFDIDRRFEAKVIVPGFVDPRTHPVLGAMVLGTEIIAFDDWDVPGRPAKAARDAREYLARLTEAVRRRDAKEVLFTWGYDPAHHGKLGRSELDAAAPGRAIVVWPRASQEFILSSAARARYATEGEARIAALVSRELFTPRRFDDGMKALRRWLPAAGVTAIAEPGALVQRAPQDSLERSFDHPDTPFRTFFIADGTALFQAAKKADEMDDLVKRTESYSQMGKGRVRWPAKQVALFTDGTFFARRMQLKDGVAKGEWAMAPEDFRRAFRMYWDAGFQIQVHANGDAALDLAISTLRAASTASARVDHRTTVGPIAISSQAQIGDLAALGSLATVNAFYASAADDRPIEWGIGAAQASSLARLATAARTGMGLSLHSGFPEAPPRPLALAGAAVARAGSPGRATAPGERLPAERALAAITIEAAHAIGQENEIGSLRAGKAADFAILEDDPTAVAADRLAEVRVWGTVFAGRVYPATGAAGNR
jgi:predicted amidohydrolase YtcJ